MGILHSFGRGSMGETSFLIRNFKIVLIIWANNYIIDEERCICEGGNTLVRNYDKRS